VEQWLEQAAEVSSYYADTHIGRGVMRRVEVVEVDDTGPIQKVTVMGLADEFYELPLRGQPHGLTSVPKVGSVGYLMLANGRPDQAFLMGLEHPDDRPTGRAEGEATMYATPGQRVDMDKDGNVAIRSAAGGVVHINPPA
jgi:phage baseplate assembly protein V